MPIRLADIPNAPGAGNPSMVQGGATLPAIPRGAFLDGASLSRAGANLREGPVDSSAVNAGVNAMQNFGAAVRQLAGVPADLSLRIQKAQNVADIARADVIMRDAWGAHQDKLATLPTSEWESEWKSKGLPSVQDQLAKLNLSRAAQDQLAPDFIQWQGITSTQVRTQAVKQDIQNNRQAVVNIKDRSILDENYDLGIAHIRQAEKVGLFSPAEADAHIVDIEARVKAKAKTAQSDRIVSGIEMDPWSMKPKLEAVVRGESVPELGPLEPTKAARFLSMAETQVRSKTAELRNDLRDKALTGEISDPETLRAAAGGKLSEAVILSLQGIMGKEIAFDPASVSKIRTAIAGYDPENDHGAKQYNEIMTAIESGVPQKRQAILSSELNKAWKDAQDGKGKDPSTLVTSAVYKQIDKLGSLGVYDEKQERFLTDKEKEAYRLSPEVQNRRGARELELKQRFEAWLKKNPDPTGESITTWLNGETAGDILKSGAKIPKESMFNWWNVLPPVQVYNVSSAVKQMATGRKTTSRADLVKQVDDALQLPQPDEGGTPDFIPDADPNNLIP